MKCKKPNLSAATSYCKYKCRCERCRIYSRKHNYKWHLQKRYGLTEEDYKNLGNKCHICGTDKSGIKGVRGLLVDHDHSTGKVRGLLCNKCNLGIANFNDSVLDIASALAYLYKHKHDSEAYIGPIEESS
jgi:hypothetical protein